MPSNLGTQRQTAAPFFHSDKLNREGAARGLNQTYVFNPTNPAIQGDTVPLADAGLYTLCQVWFDNSASPAPSVLLIKGMNQTIVAPAYWQGYVHLLANPELLDYILANNGGAAVPAGYPVTLIFMNVAIEDATAVPVQPPFGLQGSPFNISATGANAILTLTMPNVPGRRAFVSSFSVTGAGSTAGLAANVTLSGIESVGAAQTLDYAIVAPVGVLVPAQPLSINYGPPVPVLAGQPAVLTVSAFGAGNTLESATLSGFYI